MVQRVISRVADWCGRGRVGRGSGKRALSAPCGEMHYLVFFGMCSREALTRNRSDWSVPLCSASGPQTRTCRSFYELKQFCKRLVLIAFLDMWKSLCIYMRFLYFFFGSFSFFFAFVLFYPVLFYYYLLDACFLTRVRKGVDVEVGRIWKELGREHWNQDIMYWKIYFN